MLEARGLQRGGVSAVDGVEMGEEAGGQRPGDRDEQNQSGDDGRRGERGACPSGACAPGLSALTAGEDDAHEFFSFDSSSQSRSTPTLAAVAVMARRVGSSWLRRALPAEAALRFVRRRTSITG